jgi:hypothetical protein
MFADHIRCSILLFLCLKRDSNIRWNDGQWAYSWKCSAAERPILTQRRSVVLPKAVWVGDRAYLAYEETVEKVLQLHKFNISRTVRRTAILLWIFGNIRIRLYNHNICLRQNVVSRRAVDGLSLHYSRSNVLLCCHWAYPLCHVYICWIEVVCYFSTTLWLAVDQVNTQNLLQVKRKESGEKHLTFRQILKWIDANIFAAAD